MGMAGAAEDALASATDALSPVLRAYRGRWRQPGGRTMRGRVISLKLVQIDGACPLMH
jgi:hypothetical protein